MCLSILDDFLNSSYIKSSINYDGSLYISYDAYSTDSSFDESIEGFKYCPYCGESIKSIFDREARIKQQKLEQEYSKKLEQEKKLEAERKKQNENRINSALSNLNTSILNGNYIEYYVKQINETRKALNKQNLVDILFLEGINISKTSLKCVGVYRKGIKEVQHNKLTRQEQYNKNKLSKTGDKCICPSCNSNFIKKTYQQVFCKITCKDNYWNKN